MKLQKLTLPVVALMALSACSGSSQKEVENGKLPEGGTEIVERENVEKKLAAAAVNSSEAYSKATSVGLSYNQTSTNVSLKCDKFEASVNVDPFTIQAGVENLNGKKEEFKAGVKLAGLKAALNAKAGEESKTINLEVGDVGVYLQNDNLYVDASNAKVADLAAKVVGLAKVYLKDNEQFAPYLPYITLLGLDTAEGIDTVLKGMLGDTFNYKVAYNGLGLSYPLLPEVKEENAEAKIKEMLDAINAVGEVEYKDILKFYTYDNGQLGLQLDINKETMTKLAGEQLTANGVTLQRFNVNAAVVTNKEGVLASAGYIIDIQAEVQNEQIPESYGKVVLETNLAGSLALNLGSNEVTFPSSYDDYVSLNEIINNFLPSGEDEGEEEEAGFSLGDLSNLGFDLSDLSGLSGLTGLLA